ncbi:TrbI/VirB10 family protein [Sphingomonas crocodyli]|uniref:TrbI/VirB10 family protein n=2 Tax=Sphingomonas crocodyli TaxID=1979270 RepID=A0A437LYP5_9SPHN|nr:TrbI/VirB10 family protein [Sphingomonas crocodyli]
MAGERQRDVAGTSAPTRDATPAVADIDRGAIGSIGDNTRTNLMRGGAFAAVAAVVGVFFITQSGPGRGDGRTQAEKRAEATPVKAVVDYAQVMAHDAADPRLVAGEANGRAPQLSDVIASNPQVPAITPSGSEASQDDRTPQRSAGQIMADAKRRAPLIAFGGGQAHDRQGDRPGEPPSSSPVSAEGDATDLDRLRRQSSVKIARASMLGDRDTLVTAGTLLPCVLQSAINSTQPGYTSCTIPRDIFSDNGNVIVMEKGTRVLGEYRGGISQGQNRLFILWTRAVTPSGVAIDLASPASDALGRSGVPGTIDSHFWDRFGGALLLSLIDDGMQVAGQALADRGSNTTQVPSDAAGVALQNSVGIKPVLRKNQGEDVGIFVAQDFDFAHVYGLRLKR